MQLTYLSAELEVGHDDGNLRTRDDDDDEDDKEEPKQVVVLVLPDRLQAIKQPPASVHQHHQLHTCSKGHSPT